MVKKKKTGIRGLQKFAGIFLSNDAFINIC